MSIRSRHLGGELIVKGESDGLGRFLSEREFGTRVFVFLRQLFEYLRRSIPWLGIDLEDGWNA
jgi:hypothetical protein